MKDINKHPQQKELNSNIAYVLSETVKSLNLVAAKYDVSKSAIIRQFMGSLELYTTQDSVERIGEFERNGHIDELAALIDQFVSDVSILFNNDSKNTNLALIVTHRTLMNLLENDDDTKEGIN